MNEAHVQDARTVTVKASRRVGSLSMGVTLLLIGAALAASLWIDALAYDMLLWVAPFVFIMLGIELLASLKRSGEDQPVLKYDWISVFFVGVLGAASLLFAAFTSTGIMQEIRYAVAATERSAFVDTTAAEVPDGINKIIVQSLEPVTIEPVQQRQVQLMGQIGYWSEEPMPRIADDLIRTSVSGSTMVVMIGKIPSAGGRLTADRTWSQLTLTVPEGIEVEQR